EVEPVVTQQITDTQVTEWVKSAFSSLSKYDFENYQQKVDDASQYFTKAAWKRYKPILLRSKKFKLVAQEKLSVTGTIEGDGPKVIKKEKNHWTVRFPAKISFHSTNATLDNDIIVTLEVVNSNPAGQLAIDDIKIVAAPYGV